MNETSRVTAVDPVTRINPSSLPDVSAIGYSQISVVESERLAFVSGQVAVAGGGAPTPTGFEDQAGIVVQNARAALEALGASPADLALVRVYVVDLTSERTGALVPHLMNLFAGARPSLTAIGVAALATPEFLLELEMTVRVPR